MEYSKHDMELFLLLPDLQVSGKLNFMGFPLTSTGTSNSTVDPDQGVRFFFKVVKFFWKFFLQSTGQINFQSFRRPFTVPPELRHYTTGFPENTKENYESEYFEFHDINLQNVIECRLPAIRPTRQQNCLLSSENLSMLQF